MAGKKYYSYRGHAGQRRADESSDGLFGWTVFIFLLIGLVFLCWMGSYYIFARPEQSANYRLLQRLHKMEPPQRFEITEAPRGEFLKPGQLLERFGSMTPGEIRRANETLLRSFIRNYHQNRDLVPYAVGTYRVIGVFPLSSETFCSSGYTVLLQAVEQPEVVLEQLFTATEQNLPALKRALPLGQEIKLEKPLDLSAVVHIDRLADNRIRLTTMPLLYGSYGSGQGRASFSLEPPSVLNIGAGLPVIAASEIDHLPGGIAGRGKDDKTSGHLVRIPGETATPTPEPRIAKAIPVSIPPQPDDANAPRENLPQGANEPVVARAIPVNAPAVLPAIPIGTPVKSPASPPPATAIPKAIPVGTPLATLIGKIATATPSPASRPSAPAVPPSSLAMTNVSTAAATNAPIAAPVPSGPWPVYAPGQMPRGQLLEASESQSLAGHGIGNERHYLKGRFAVTASGNGKAVLRPEGAIAGLPMGPSSRVRVIVEFPSGTTPPGEGNTISRDSLRPFQITSVKRGDDGQINVYAREVTRGE